MPEPRRTATVAPRIDAIQLGSLGAGSPELLAANADLEGLRFSEIVTDHLDVTAAAIYGCQFAGVSALEADWKSTRLFDTTIERLYVPVMRASRGVWRSVYISGSRLGSVEAYLTSWNSVHFVGCKLSFINLREAELLDVAFTDCIIEELDLMHTTARRVSLQNTRVSRLALRHSTLENVDLRGGDLEEIDGLDGLRGATISSLQLSVVAPLLARQMGIRIEDV